MKIVAFVTGLLFVFSLSVLLFADEPFNPWAGFGKDSWVKYKNTIVMSGSENVSYTKTTLVAKDDTSITLKVELFDAEGNATFSQTKKEYLKGNEEEGEKYEEKGTEEITVDGKKYNCSVVVITKENLTITSYFSKDVATKLVKSVVEIDMMGTETKTTITLDKTDEEVKIGDKTYKCVSYKISSKTENREMSGTIWMNNEVPSYFVKQEVTSKMAGMETKNVTELDSFEVKK